MIFTHKEFSYTVKGVRV